MSEPDAIDDALIRRAMAGDREAVDDLFRAYLTRVEELVRRRLGMVLRSRLETQDIAQTALAEAFRDLDQFQWRGARSFDRWLHRIVENKIRQKAIFFRRQKRNIFREIAGESSGMPRLGPVGEPVEGRTPSRILGHRQELERVERAMEKLPEPYAEVVRWARIEKLPYREIGNRLGGKSEDAVRKILMRALIKLSTLLDGEVPSPDTKETG